jgi:cobalt transporter subunit CbtA
MLARTLTVALLAGALAGALVSAAQMVRVVPLILEAEVFEVADHSEHTADEATWSPEDGLERTTDAIMANLLVGVGFGLLLVGAFILAETAGRPIDALRGLLWGLAAFLVFALIPSVGLPPELPGTAAAELPARQLWWIGTAGATALGLGLIAFGRPPWLKVLALPVMALPHLIGAPQPSEHGGTAPAELAREFVIASLATTGLFWIALGTMSGWLYKRIVAHTWSGPPT